MFKVSFCEKDITPPLGTIIPGSFGARFSDGVAKPLMARVICVSDGAKKQRLRLLMLADYIRMLLHASDREFLKKYSFLPSLL